MFFKDLKLNRSKHKKVKFYYVSVVLLLSQQITTKMSNLIEMKLLKPIFNYFYFGANKSQCKKLTNF